MRAVAAMDKLMNDPEGVKLLMEMQANPTVMQAAMEISTGGEAAAAKYANNREVMAYMEKLQAASEGKIG